MLRDPEDVVRRLGEDAGLNRAEATLYIELLKAGSLPCKQKGPQMRKLLDQGMAILSGDGKSYVPVHPRLGIANHYRTWREQMVREINERRMRVDRLILELIPLYEAATDKRMSEGGG